MMLQGGEYMRKGTGLHINTPAGNFLQALFHFAPGSESHAASPGRRESYCQGVPETVEEKGLGEALNLDLGVASGCPMLLSV
jgi:hypothetical protein